MGVGFPVHSQTTQDLTFGVQALVIPARVDRGENTTNECAA